MIRYINEIGPELEQGVKPPFIVEKEAVAAYALRRGEPQGIRIYRGYDHRYSYTSHQDRRKRTVIAVTSLEDAPPSFVVEQAETIKGLHVYCPQDAGKPPPAPQRAEGKASKRKEAER